MAECCNPEIAEAVRESRRGKKVRAVSLFRCEVDDGCAVKLATLKHLEWLELKGTTITNAGMAGLEPLTGLKYLDLSLNRCVTDAGLVSLAGMQRLELLRLNGLRGVTDAGLASLCSLRT